MLNEGELQLLDMLIAEYGLRARYNTDKTDYKMYSMLVNVRKILMECEENPYTQAHSVFTYNEKLDKTFYHGFRK